MTIWARLTLLAAFGMGSAWMLLIAAAETAR